MGPSFPAPLGRRVLRFDSGAMFNSTAAAPPLGGLLFTQSSVKSEPISI